MAPEFYRRVYKRNPTKWVDKIGDTMQHTLLSEATWKEILLNKGSKSGNN